MTVTAILLAAGAGTRVQQPTNKVYLPVGDRPLVRWPLETLLASPVIDDVVLVVRDGELEQAAAAVGDDLRSQLRGMVAGGATRHASEHAGLESLAPDIERGEIELVAIHDAARPLLGSALLRHTVEAARAVGGAVPVLALDPAAVRVDDGHLSAGVRVERLRRVQTPQVFAAAPLLAAYRAAAVDGFAGSDTAASVLQYARLDIAAVPGDPANVKVTFAEDVTLAEALAGQAGDRD